MQDFRRLLVWQKAHPLALDVHRETQKWGRRDNSGLGSQARRAAQSIPANLAEGCGRHGDREFARFVQIAIGSSTELEYHLQFAGEAGIMSLESSRALQERVAEVRRMMVGLLKRLRGGGGTGGEGAGSS
jgi:four helix bundle protein